MKKLILMGLLMLSTTGVDAAFYGGGKSLGMGLTGTANPQDAIDPIQNPASWAKIQDQVNIGAYANRDQGHMKISNNFNPFANSNGHYNSTHTPWTGGAALGVKLAVNDWVSVGLAVYPTLYSKTTFKKTIPLYGTSNLGLELRDVNFEGGIGFDLGCLELCGTSLGHHYLGVSARCCIQRFKVNGIQSFANPLLSSSVNHVTNKGYNYSTGVAPVIGWLGEINQYVSLGVSYQPRISMTKVRKYKGIVAAKGNLDVPAEVTVGVLLTPLCNMHVAFDVTHAFIKKVPIYGNSFSPNVLTNQAGTNKGLGFGLSDQTFYCLGADYSFTNDITVRAGYIYSPSISKKSSAVTDLLLTDYLKNVVTVGATYRPYCNFEIDAYFLYGFKVCEKANNSIPIQFGGGNINYNTQRLLVGLSLSWLL